MGLAAPRHVGSSWIRDWTHVPHTSRQILYHWATREAPLYCCIHILPGTLWFHPSHLLVRKQWGEKQSSSGQQPKCTFKNCHSDLVVPLLKTLNWTSHPLRRLQFLQRPMSPPWFCPCSFLMSPSTILLPCPALQPPWPPQSLRSTKCAPAPQKTSAIPSAWLFSLESCSLTSFRTSLKCHFLNQNFPDILFLKWQFLFQHSPPFFIIFLILYHYTIYFTCLFILFTVCLPSCTTPPKDKLLHDKQFWVLCSLIKFQCLRQSVVNSKCPVNICQIVNKKTNEQIIWIQTT